MVTVAFIIIIVAILFLLFPIAYVNGESMKPTLKDGQLLLCTRLGEVKEDDIAVFLNEETERLSVKRCTKRASVYNAGTDKDEYRYFFVGDNRDNSFDSRQYGYVREGSIVAKVILPKNL